MPAFAAAYTGSSRIAITGPVTLATFTTRPQPRAAIGGATCRVTRKAVSRLRRSPACQVARLRSARRPASKSVPTLTMPALFTRRSTDWGSAAT